jgi:hypothetical protein
VIYLVDLITDQDLTPCFSDVDDDGNVTGAPYVGHAVENLGAPLPTLDNADERVRAQRQQRDVHRGQRLGLLMNDAFYVDLYLALEDGKDRLRDGTPIKP